MKFFIFLVTVFFTSTIAYTQSYVMSLNSISVDVPSSDKNYFLKFGDSVKSKISDLENFRNISLLTKVLANNGYKRVLDTLKEKHNFIIDFNFFISQPIVPNTGTTSISSTNTKITNEVKIEQNNSTNNTNIKAIEFKPPIDISNMNYSGIGPQAIITYKRHMKLNCLSVNDNYKKVWFIELDSEGYSNDLRQIIPIMIYATQGFYEKDSKGVKEIIVRENKKEVKRFLEDN